MKTISHAFVIGALCFFGAGATARTIDKDHEPPASQRGETPTPDKKPQERPQEKPKEKPKEPPDKKPGEKPDQKPKPPNQRPSPGGDEIGGVRVSTTGTVKSVTSDSITVVGARGQEFTFTVDTKTMVTRKGFAMKAAGKASGTRGGGVAITDLVATGDKVTVKAEKSGATMHAASVQVEKK